MFRRTLLSLTASLFIFTNVTPAHAFHNGNSGALTAQTDSQSGSANFGVPIDVPPGRAGIQPNLQLQYSSSLPNGLLGVGWSLELGSIQRSTKKGVPSYTDSDTFVLVQSGSGQELVFDATAGFYRAKVEGAFMRIQKSGNAWVVTDKKGTKYYFGTTQNAQEYDPGDATRIFKWCLSSVEDLQGNTMTIQYSRYDSKLYPYYIIYTANPSNGLAGFAAVEFIWSPRPEPMNSHAAGFWVETYYRLSRVNTWVGTNLQYRFDLAYHVSNATGRSLLESITQYGSDGTAALPPLKFQYQEYVNEPRPAYDLVNTSLTNPSAVNNQLFGDFNGDGRTDRLVFDPVDNDGAADFCVFYPSTGRWDVFVSYLSSEPHRFTGTGTWISGFGAGQEPTTGDFNGDGLTDIAYFYEDANTGYKRAAIALNVGGGYFQEVPGATPIIGNAGSVGISGDFNGDGLTDLGFWEKASGLWQIRFNPGDIKATFPLMAEVSGFGPGKQPMIADFNSDGLTDIGYYDNSSQKAVYRLSTGRTFTNEQSLFLGWSTEDVHAVEFNGDGLPDFVSANAPGPMAVNYSRGVFPDLLAKSDNGVGGTTTVEYAPSTTFDNPRLPFALQLVKSAGQSSNRGDVYTSRYDYAQGLWVNRQFLGFGSVKVIDPENNYVVTEFLRNGDTSHTLPVKQYSYSADNSLFAKTEYLWTFQEIAPGINFAYLSAKDNFIYDGNSSGR
ncbi:MAG: VCBS repeat-containing protein, partial [Candidatus Omnitrophica bacterium]|nr:VCBS repeat-containing protein [Candidatus Omnitrophota bacterium]